MSISGVSCLILAVLIAPFAAAVTASAQTTDPIYNEIMAYAARHGMSAAQLIAQSPMDRISFEEYVATGQRAGRSIDSMIEQLISSSKANSGTQNEASSTLTTADVERIKDAYEKTKCVSSETLKGNNSRA